MIHTSLSPYSLRDLRWYCLIKQQQEDSVMPLMTLSL
jgi:hypothetical protein